jgi:hypothetical protein
MTLRTSGGTFSERSATLGRTGVKSMRSASSNSIPFNATGEKVQQDGLPVVSPSGITPSAVELICARFIGVFESALRFR